jgi:hypothetical protein
MTFSVGETRPTYTGSRRLFGKTDSESAVSIQSVGARGSRAVAAGPAATFLGAFFDHLKMSADCLC